MRNVNYNLLKLLHGALDDQWRIERHYLKDAKKNKCKNCVALLTKMDKQFKANIGAIQAEMGRHMGKKGRLA